MCVYTSLCRQPLSFSANEAGPSADAGPSGMCSQGLGNKTYSACTVKVMRADKRLLQGGKIELIPQESTYVTVKAATANVRFIEEHIKKVWGEEYSLVSKEGVPICDSPATRRKD